MALISTANNLAELYKIAADQHGDLPAFATRDKDKVFQTVTFREIYGLGVNLATALIDLGVQARDHVSILADNRLEWIISDYAVLLCGAADVPRGSDLTDGDVTYILPHSGAKVVFVENNSVLNKVLNNKDKLPDVSHIIMMDKDTKVTGDVLGIYDLIEKGKQLREGGDRRVEERIAQIKPDDLFTLIYTSGTTGPPKGVMLMHRNMLSQVRNLTIEIKGNDRILSILPVWHIFERVFEMFSIASGCCTYYTNVRHLKDDFAIVQPTFMASAPRLWENIYNGVLASLQKAPPVRRKLFDIAYFCSKTFKGAQRFLGWRLLNMEGRNPILSLLLGCWHLVMFLLFLIPNFLLDTVVLSKIRLSTGGKLRASVSGGGALPSHVDLFFNNVGIPVLEGYGMTETCPVLAVRSLETLVIGTVGPLFPETEVRLMDLNSGNVLYPPKSGRGKKGEIHVKGPQVMKGYYKNPEATNKVLKDGWMNTGDLGVFTFNNCLKIVGRSKETVVLLGGENVEPVPIETKLQESPYIFQCMVTGQDKKNLTVLIVPAVEAMNEYGQTIEEISKNDKACAFLKNEVKQLISAENGFKAFEKVLDCRVLPKEFTVGDEFTNLFKTKRHVVTDKYDSLIESMYA